MTVYAYRCPVHGDFDDYRHADAITCHRIGPDGQRCDARSPRNWRVAVNAESARHRGRWDPVVGQYVESERQFRSLLAEGQDRESARLNMDVKLQTIDARDHEGLAELHGISASERDSHLESTRRAARDQRR